MKSIQRYQRSRQLKPRIVAPPSNALRLVCVIPCMNEPEMLANLLHLQSCEMPDAAMEFIIVINHSRTADEACRQLNEDTAREISRRVWPDRCRCHVIPLFDLPPEASGVGVARKAGMDEAMLRLAAVNAVDGLIVSLDADCRVDAHYFRTLHETAVRHPEYHAMLCDFYHPVEELNDTEHRKAMLCYEVLLRTIALGWAYAGLPYAFIAIGSCMVVRANAYARHHGMNTRQAGEDFYFMHKLAREREIAVLHEVRVYPSPRLSTRTPFGTGQAVRQLQSGETELYRMATPEVFVWLRQMSGTLDDVFIAGDAADWLASLPEMLGEFLLSQGAGQAIPRMLNNAASVTTFRKHYFTWFDGLKAWRFVHLCRKHQSMDVLRVAECMLAMLERDACAPRERQILAERVQQWHESLSTPVCGVRSRFG